MQLQPMIAVRDVAASSRFYQDLLDARSGHGGDEAVAAVEESGAGFVEGSKVDAVFGAEDISRMITGDRVAG